MGRCASSSVCPRKGSFNKRVQSRAWAKTHPIQLPKTSTILAPDGERVLRDGEELLAVVAPGEGSAGRLDRRRVLEHERRVRGRVEVVQQKLVPGREHERTHPHDVGLARGLEQFSHLNYPQFLARDLACASVSSGADFWCKHALPLILVHICPYPHFFCSLFPSSGFARIKRLGQEAPSQHLSGPKSNSVR